MTIGEWLRERSPAPPERLLARIDQALGARTEADASTVASVCVETAATMLSGLLSAEATGRETAIDLLTIDALVTYAFEAASQHPESIAPLAEDSLIRLAAVSRA